MATNDNNTNIKELTNGIPKLESRNNPIVLNKNSTNDLVNYGIDGDTKHSISDKDLNKDNSVDVTTNGATIEDVGQKILCEKTPFLHHMDSEDNNDTIDNSNQNCSTLTSNVIAKISNPQMLSKNFRDV